MSKDMWGKDDSGRVFCEDIHYSWSEKTSGYRMVVDVQSSYLTALNGLKMKMQRMSSVTDGSGFVKEVWGDVK